MFAVIKTGGKQYRIKQGDKLRVESLDADEGDTVNLDQVLMAGDGADVVIGNPTVSSASVSAKVLSHGRGRNHSNQWSLRWQLIWLKEFIHTKIRAGKVSTCKKRKRSRHEFQPGVWRFGNSEVSRRSQRLTG